MEGRICIWLGSSLSHRVASAEVLKRPEQCQVYLVLGSTILLVIFVSVGCRLLLSHFPKFKRLYWLLAELTSLHGQIVAVYITGVKPETFSIDLEYV